MTRPAKPPGRLHGALMAAAAATAVYYLAGEQAWPAWRAGIVSFCLGFILGWVQDWLRALHAAAARRQQ